MITLYHYTSNGNADQIQREKHVRASTMRTRPQYRQHGCGVYFTSLSPSVEPKKLALNNFTNGGTPLTTQHIRKLSSVIKIDFHKNEVDKIKKRDRDLYIYRDSIDLNDYEGRYQIYRNPNNELAILLARI